ncbi:CaiB Predicted acyl-CoA transferases/carnitine dehydratase [Burkholderiaceae bacterium]
MGPLTGVRIVELAGIGPAPFAAMLLADLGATVIRVERPVPSELGIQRPLKYNLLLRNRQELALDLKNPECCELVLKLLEEADGLIEGFRPGVTERLGLGPDICLARNPRLVYGRMTGWGQEGPLSQAAGHDLNYIAITGVLDWLGRDGNPPTIPQNLVGDYAGGGMYLALGMLSAMLHSRKSGQGQVVDAAIVDGTASLATSLFGMHAAGMLQPRGRNILDGGAPYYDVYACKDGEYICIAPIEAKFYAEFCERLGLDPKHFGKQNDRQAWPVAKETLSQLFVERTQQEWCALLEGTDACFSPVLSASQAAQHPHLVARKTFVEVEGVTQPAPAPRFSHSPTELPTPPHLPTHQSGLEALKDWLGDEAAANWSKLLGQSAKS